MRFRQLGQTDLEVSAIAFGCWAIVGDGTWGHQDKNDAIAALRTAMDVGVNLWQAESRIQ